MKKIIKFLLVSFLFVGIVGCGGSSVPDGMSGEVYEYGKKVLKITDKFLDGKNDSDKSYEEISELKKPKDKEENDKEVLDNIAFIEFEILMDAKDSSDLKISRDSLAKQLLLEK